MTAAAGPFLHLLAKDSMRGRSFEVENYPNRERTRKAILPTTVQRYTYQGACTFMRVLYIPCNLKELGNERKQLRYRAPSINPPQKIRWYLIVLIIYLRDYTQTTIVPIMLTIRPIKRPKDRSVRGNSKEAILDEQGESSPCQPIRVLLLNSKATQVN
ncbi:MAG: hypothetical protein KDD45_11385 [Bdellovibrionales bacterium]|nr:hypothetical protein [Bdellovibrionales bacterium]